MCGHKVPGTVLDGLMSERLSSTRYGGPLTSDNQQSKRARLDEDLSHCVSLVVAKGIPSISRESGLQLFSPREASFNDHLDGFS
jgi:hypothetical protein